MLILWRRHKSTCPHKEDRYFRKCRCAVHCEGTVEGQYIRRSLKTRSWTRGEILKRQIEDGEAPAEPSVTVAEAKRLFIEHLKKKNVSSATVRKFEIILDKLAAFTDLPLNGINTPLIEKFRNEWTWSALTSAKYIERLRSFWKHAMRQEWVKKNPALDLAMPKVPPKQVSPFEPEELLAIEAEASKHPRHYAMVLLLRHSGLRIADAVMLQRRKLKDGNLFLYTAKTGAPVWLPLPEHVVEALEKCPNKSNDFFFATGEGKKQTAVNNWRDDLSKLFTRAEVEGAHPHRYRHTLAASLLEQGVTVTEVAMILGNSPQLVATVYAGWDRARQKKLSENIRTTWKPALVQAK
jgi:integrase/recombinase XerD